MRRDDLLVKKAHSRHPVSFETPRDEPPADRRPDPYNARCPTRLVLDRIGDKWSVLTIGLLSAGPMRFNRLRQRIAGITQKTLSLTLKALERDGLVTRTVRPTTPVEVEYALTPLGATLVAAIEALQTWARDHIAEVGRAQERYDFATRKAAGRNLAGR